METLNLNYFDILENWYQKFFSQIKIPQIKIDNNQTSNSIPNTDIPKSTRNDGWFAVYGFEHIIKQVKNILENRIKENLIPNMQFIYYPKNGYMNWHTNSDNPSTRIYLVRAEENPLSEMKFENKIIKDKPLWSFNIFNIGNEDNLNWHCINAKSERLSLGFHYKGNKTIKELEELLND